MGDITYDNHTLPVVYFFLPY